MLRRGARLGGWAVGVWLAGVLARPLGAATLTPDSPEVQAALRKAVKYLESDEAKEDMQATRGPWWGWPS